MSIFSLPRSLLLARSLSPLSLCPPRPLLTPAALSVHATQPHDPRLEVTVAGENGFAETTHPGGSSNNLTPSQIEAEEEGESERKVEIERNAAHEEQVYTHTHTHTHTRTQQHTHTHT